MKQRDLLRIIDKGNGVSEIIFEARNGEELNRVASGLAGICIETPEFEEVLENALFIANHPDAKAAHEEAKKSALKKLGN